MVSLPNNIPPPWLLEIRTAVKADSASPLWTLLGSAVLAALIAAGSSILTAWVTIRANENLEVRKTQLEISRAEISESLRSHDTLDRRLSELQESYAGVASLIHIAGPALKNRKDATRIRSEISKVGEKEGEIIALRTDFHIDQDTWTIVNKAVNEVTNAIQDSNSDEAAFALHAASINSDLDEAIRAVRRKKSQTSARLADSVRP